MAKTKKTKPSKTKSKGKGKKQPKQIAQQFADFLNSILKEDHAAIHAMVINRIPCNTNLENHTPCPVTTIPFRSVGLLGIVNGFLLSVKSEQMVLANFLDNSDPDSTLCDNEGMSLRDFTTVSKYRILPETKPTKKPAKTYKKPSK